MVGGSREVVERQRSRGKVHGHAGKVVGGDEMPSRRERSSGRLAGADPVDQREVGDDPDVGDPPVSDRVREGAART